MSFDIITYISVSLLVYKDQEAVMKRMLSVAMLLILLKIYL